MENIENPCAFCPKHEECAHSCANSSYEYTFPNGVTMSQLITYQQCLQDETHPNFAQKVKPPKLEFRVLDFKINKIYLLKDYIKRKYKIGNIYIPIKRLHKNK